MFQDPDMWIKGNIWGLQFPDSRYRKIVSTVISHPITYSDEINHAVDHTYLVLIKATSMQWQELDQSEPKSRPQNQNGK